uniref:Uncharacterized protein n=1 Tax=Streptomyces sp. NBC_01393 TaxID=2903851 RepID=A0AAU3IA54_9ACTN
MALTARNYENMARFYRRTMAALEQDNGLFMGEALTEEETQRIVIHLGSEAERYEETVLALNEQAV